MFGIGTTELLIIILVALVVLGPSKLPEIMKAMGKGIAEFKRLSTDVKSTLDAEVTRAEREEKRKEKVLAEKKAKTSQEASSKAAKNEASLAAEASEAGAARPVDDAAPTRPEVAEGPVVDVQAAKPADKADGGVDSKAGDKGAPGGDKA